MKQPIAMLLAVAGLALAAAWPAAQAAHAEPSAPEVPADIAAPAGSKLFLVGHAVGVQIYRCNVTASGYRWGFVGPKADLYGDSGKLIATHFAGPRWQALDGSQAVGAVVRPVTVDPTAIPWLLLSASGTPGVDGDRLADTTAIQRINTTGGLAPAAEECYAGTAGNERQVPYTADYYFYKRSDAV
jgi:hypothetical protein